MTGANHVLTGAVIGAVIKEPAAALPLALASHFVLDSLPHFGFSSWEERKKYKNLLEIVLIVDAIMLVAVVSLLLNTSATWLVIACAAIAVAPDLVWVYRYIVPERFGKLEPAKGMWLTEFHRNIQKREFPRGFIIEYVAFTVLIAVLVATV